GGRIVIRALAALPESQEEWHSPGLAVVGGFSRGETLTLRIHPHLRLEAWNPGGFEWVDALTTVDQSHVLSLRSTLRSSPRPGARLHRAGPVFDVKEILDWRLDPDRSTVTAQVTCSIRHGVLPSLTLDVPRGWAIDSVESEPADPALRWSVSPLDNRLNVMPG